MNEIRRTILSILDGFIREELLRQITGALKPYLTVQQAARRAYVSNASNLHQIYFTTELAMLSSDRIGIIYSKNNVHNGIPAPDWTTDLNCKPSSIP